MTSEPSPLSDHQNSQRIALFGSTGQLGAELNTLFRTRGDEVACFGRSEVDITDPASVQAAITRFKPSAVVNAAAYNQVDQAEREPEAAFRINALAVRNLAIAARDADAALVHFSTDYVFDGLLSQPHTEEEPPHPLGAYAVSKLAGEYYARAYSGRALIIRTCGVFGPEGAHTPRGNFVELMLRLARENQPIRVVDDHIASPTYAPDLAQRTVELMDRSATGILHIGGGSPISWYDWAAKIFNAAGLKPSLSATNQHEFQTAARRPLFSALSNAKMESLGLAPMPSLDDAIRRYLEIRATAVNPPAG